MNKTRNNYLIKLADRALREQACILKNESDILESYDGQTASMSVSVVMSGLLPTLAMFYQDKPDGKKAARRNVLDAVARIITLAEV